METVRLSSTLSSGKSFLEKVQTESQVNVRDCYQCGKCSAGCPFVEAMDYSSHKILRLLQLGQIETVLKSKSIWICSHCATCYTRCPKKVDIPRLMEFLRMEANRQGFIGEKTVNIFSNLFLTSVRLTGRVHEMGTMGFYNLLSGHLFQDVLSAPGLFFNGKITPIPHLIKNRKVIQKIFANTKQRQGES
ncbi:MAG: 4Fe-4S dicluster domain-containing protein [Zhaonellaceae bacterium]|jgi:heterodisulfide reductase subunit C|nr:heterodisulfide reductase subunit C [Clostridia bacterium]